MLNGKANPLFISILIHVILIAAIASIEFKLPEQKTKSEQSIKSYIYTPPKAQKAEQVNVAIKEEENPVSKDTVELKKIDTNETITKAPPKAKQPEVKPVIPDNKKSVQAALLSKQELAKKTDKKSFSAIKQLSKLRTQLDQQIINQEFSVNQTTRSPSIMHSAPETVPKSVIPLTQEQKKYQATTSYSDSLSITKNDDGTCTIERDLGYAGIEGVKSREGFDCGESKFDRSFREHMKKVQARLGK